MLRNIRGMICLTPEQICDGLHIARIGGMKRNFVVTHAKRRNSRDCPDGEDEQGCKDLDECRGSAMMCKAEGKCLPAHKICDGVNDCTDELHLLQCSGTGKNLCNDGTCITMDKLCDGTADCGEGYDEHGCPS
ncbi:unnamed protein product, partial [Mesorhabditis spiculigera]